MSSQQRAECGSERGPLTGPIALDILDLEPGVVRENVTTLGIDLTSLEVGQKLALGEGVVLQLSMPCAPCSHMEDVRPGLQEGDIGLTLLSHNWRRDLRLRAGNFRFAFRHG